MNYTGVLVDATTGLPVAGATIEIETGTNLQSLEVGTGYQSPKPQILYFPGTSMAGVQAVGQTATNGQFSFSAPVGDFAITFSKIGYYPVSYGSLQLAGTPAATLEIIPGSAETLDAVVVKPALKWVLGAAAIATLIYYSQKK